MPRRVRQRVAAAAIHDGIDEDAAEGRRARGPDERERGDVFDLAARISRRELDVGDDRVFRVCRIQLAVSLAGNPFVRRARRLDFGDLQLDDIRMRSNGAEHETERERCGEFRGGH